MMKCPRCLGGRVYENVCINCGWSPPEFDDQIFAKISSPRFGNPSGKERHTFSPAFGASTTESMVDRENNLLDYDGT